MSVPRRLRTTARLALAVVTGAALAVVVPAAADAASAPVVTALSRHASPTAGGELVAIRGRNLAGATQVNFGGQPVFTIHHVSASLLEVRTPQNAGSLFNVRVRTANGFSAISTPTHFRFVPPPVVTGLSSHHGTAAGGQRVAVHGRNFLLVSTVGFGGAAGSAVHVVSPELLWVTTPRHVPLDTAMRVRTAFGLSEETTPSRYYFGPPPQIATLETRTGSTGGGTLVVIIGLHFDSTTRVTFDGVPVRRVTVNQPYRVTVVTPHHPAGLVHVRATTQYGSTFPTVGNEFRYGRDGAPHWTRTTLLDRAAGSPTSISCAPDICAFADANGVVYTKAGTGTWVPTLRAPRPTQWLFVHCVSAEFCVASGTGGMEAHFDGSSWSTPAALKTGFFVAMSCVDDSQCHAVGSDGRDISWNGNTWAVGPAHKAPSALAMTCSASNRCRAVDARGNSFIYSSGTWTKNRSLGTEGITAASCADDGCLAVTAAGHAFAYDGTWSPVMDSPLTMRSIACTGDGSCSGVDIHGMLATFVGGAWSAPTAIDRDGATLYIGCRAALSCEAIDEDGYVTPFDSHGVGTSEPVDPTRGGVTHISCAQSLCVIIDQYGNTFTRVAGGEWSDPTKLTYAGSDVSCASPTWCLAVGAKHSFVFDGAQWHDLGYDGNHAAALSCPVVNYCLGLSDRSVLKFDGQHWTTTLSESLPFRDVSCSSAGHCLAISGRDARYRLIGSNWETVPMPDDLSDSEQATVECASDTMCFVGRDSGTVLELIDTRWVVTRAVTRHVGVLACSAPTRCVAVGGDAASYDGRSWTIATPIDDSDEAPWSSSAITDGACSTDTCVVTSIGYVAEASFAG